MEPKAGLCGGHPKVTLACDSPPPPRLLAVVTTANRSLSEFYYHSNEDVERYFI